MSRRGFRIMHNSEQEIQRVFATSTWWEPGYGQTGAGFCRIPNAIFWPARNVRISGHRRNEFSLRA
jgi:hypothetical protein